MNDTSSIKSTMMTSGWMEIRNKLESKKNALRLPKNINKKKGFEDIAIETLGKAYAVRVIERWLRELDQISSNKTTEKFKRFI